MKRNYLFLVAILFVVATTFFLASTHSLEPKKRKPASTSKKIERILPRLPHIGK